MIRNSFLIASLATLGIAAAGFMGGCNSGTPEAPTKTDSTTAKPGGTTAKARPHAEDTGVKVDGDTIKIGLVAAENGPDRPWGMDCITGANLAVKEINDAGGIQGKKVQLLVGDSASTPEGGKSATEKLVSDGVIGILGEVASGTTALVEQVAFAKGIPVVTVGSTRVDLAEKGDNFFRVCYNDDFQGGTMAKFAYNDLKLRNVALMTDNKLPYSQGLSDSFRKAFTALGGTIADEQFYEQGQANFQGQAESLKSKNPDGIFCSGYFTEVGAIAKAIRGAGMDHVQLLGGDGWDSEKALLSGGGDAIIGGYFCNHYNNSDPRPEVQDFIQKWEKVSNGEKPGTTMGALAYDSAKMTIEALKRCKDLTSANLIQELENTVDFKGVTGTITLKGQGGNPKKDATIVQVTKDGFKFAKTYPAE